MSGDYVLAHLSDPHLGPLARPRLRDLANKRMFGYANWRRGRDTAHRPDILERLVEDMRGQAPDHVAVTGDLMNIGLRSEVPMALAWLESLGDDEWVSVVPGNHDAYVRGSLERASDHWNAYMAGDRAHERGTERKPPRFPYLRRRGPVAILGLSSAVATAPFLATGRIGRSQMKDMKRRLATLGEEGLFRVVLVHHPPVLGATSWHKRLTDAEALAGAIREAGAELVLHGHTHLASIAWLGAAEKPIPVVGVPSASAAPGRAKAPAAYNLYRVGGAPGAWRCDLVMRGLDEDGDVVETGRMTLVGTDSPGRLILASSGSSL